MKNKPIFRKCADKKLIQNQNSREQMTRGKIRLTLDFSAKKSTRRAKKTKTTAFRQVKTVPGGVKSSITAEIIVPLNSYKTTINKAIKPDNASEIKIFLSLKNFILNNFQIGRKENKQSAV